MELKTTRTSRRRDFLRGALAAALSVAGAPALARGVRARAGEPPPASEIPIVDAHQHLWDLRKFRIPWTEKNKILSRSFLMEDYLEAAKGLGVVKTVYVEVDVEESQLAAEAEQAIETCSKKATPMAGAVIGGRPSADGFKDYIERFKVNPWVKGVRQVLFKTGPSEEHFLSKKFLEGIRLLGSLGMSFDICVSSAQFADAARLVEECPDTSFILDHCGNPDLQAPDRSAWERDLAAIARRKNIACKVSGFAASAKKDVWTAEDVAPVIRHVYRSFGPDRLIFGSDWPVCTLNGTFKKWVEALKAAVRDWSDDEKRKLFHDNALRVYKLS